MLKQMMMVTTILIAQAALAEESTMTCQASAESKKLYGAAKSSHLQKCKGDAKAMCEARSAEKKLAGAAKTSFETKCLRDAVGEMPEPAKK